MNKNSKGTIIVSSVMSVLLILVALLSWPNEHKESNITQSNNIDDSKIQIKVTAKRVNIRKEATIDSDDIGDVYAGEVYTVYEDVTGNDYYWYKIKTNTGIEGYIGSEKNNEYVELISGYIDRTPPRINYDKDYYVLYEGEEDDFSSITCTDEYSDCTIEVVKSNLYIDITAKDNKGNTSTKSIRYYDIFKGGNYFTETNNNMSINYTKKINDDKSMIVTTDYIINRMILSNNKSNNYATNISFFDEEFNIIDQFVTKYNYLEPESDCINNKDMSIKDEYKDANLNIGDKLCTSFYIPDSEKVKYFEISISGVDNYGAEGNYLSNYISRIFTK